MNLIGKIMIGSLKKHAFELLILATILCGLLASYFFAHSNLASVFITLSSALALTSLFSFRDKTRFKNAEKILVDAKKRAEEANKAKTRFLGMVSHEMRTPLNGILGMSNLLAGTKPTGEQTSYIDSITTSGSALLHLIEDMLDLTLIEAGKFKLQKQEVEINAVLTEVIELLSSRAYHKGIGLGFYIDKSVPKMIIADQARLKQVIINLVGNAIKFTQMGGVKLHCFAELKNKNSNEINICFQVADTGPGLSEADQKRIFSEFERVDDNKPRSVDGAGLGLAISKALVDQMNGNLEITKSTSKGSKTGTVFTFYLPCEFEVAAKIQPTNELQGKTVLLGMKNLMEAECIKAQIQQNGGKVVHVSSLRALVNKIKKQSSPSCAFNFIVLDPEMVASKTRDEKIQKIIADIDQLRAQSADISLRLVVLSAPSKRNELLSFLDTGADAYLIRPIREKSLLAVLAEKMPKQARPKAKAVKANTKKTAEILSGANILLVEDNHINKMLVNAALEKAGAKVTHAENGEVAVNFFKKNEFDLVLMDMHMPVMDGCEASMKIKQFEKLQDAKKNVKIFALSADDQADSKSKAFEAGIDGFLSKPINPNELIETVQRNL